MDLSDLPLLLTVEQAATFLRLTSEQVDQAIADGELAAVRLDRAVLVDTAVLLGELGVDIDHRDDGHTREVTT